jgi:hypothetical protein
MVKIDYLFPFATAKLQKNFIRIGERGKYIIEIKRKEMVRSDIK